MRSLVCCLIVLVTIIGCNGAYNWSITDQSPLITYDPDDRGSNETTWNSTYSQSSWRAYTATTVGYGQSAHTTEASDASATVRFIGTAVYVWGQAYQLSAVVYVDGIAMATSGGQNGLIAAIEGLTNDWHDVEVVSRGLAYVSVEGFTFTSSIPR